MKTFSIFALLLAMASAANLCPDVLYSIVQCCAADVLGILGLDCENPSSSPESLDDFKSGCGKMEKQAKCCTVPVVSYIPVNSCFVSWFEV